MPVKQSLIEKIRQRRAQLLIHSYLYYELDESIVSDHQWQKWADELVLLQEQYTGRIKFYDREFADWTGATGCHLPKDVWVASKARQILELNKSLTTM